MDSVMFSMLVFGIVVVIGTQTGSALKCYVCNSHEYYDGKACDDDTLDKEYLFDCDVKYKLNPKNFTMCRKMNQKVESKTRVIRDCAVEGDDRCVTRTGTKLVKIDYCECNGDGCNSADGVFTIFVKYTVFISTFLAFFISKS